MAMAQFHKKMWQFFPKGIICEVYSYPSNRQSVVCRFLSKHELKLKMFSDTLPDKLKSSFFQLIAGEFCTTSMQFARFACPDQSLELGMLQTCRARTDAMTDSVIPKH